MSTFTTLFVVPLKRSQEIPDQSQGFELFLFQLMYPPLFARVWVCKYDFSFSKTRASVSNESPTTNLPVQSTITTTSVNVKDN